MEYRNLGLSGLKVPVLSFGTGTFGGTNEFFQRWGQTDIKEASRLVDITVERGVNFFDTANVYSQGDAETILGQAIKGRREKMIISTKGGYSMGRGNNDRGASRWHLTKALEDSLRRLQTDYIDLYFIHGFDESTPIEETLRTLNTMVDSGKIRYLGASNFAAWQLQKSQYLAKDLSLEKYVVYQGYYSLIGRDYEQELMPLLQDQGMGLMAWSPLGWGRLTGKITRNAPLPEGRVKAGGLVGAPPVEDEYLYRVTDVLEEISIETGRTVTQVAINWLLRNPTVSNVVIGARNEQQLLENLESTCWCLNDEQAEKLNLASRQIPIYPHWVGKR